MTRLRILVTAGPTREPIDPVRFISNCSTGTMGLAIAAAAKKMGHKVILINASRGPHGMTARQMKAEVLKNFQCVDAVIMAAAVSDYRPAKTVPQKIKKTRSNLTLKLIKNLDILEALGRKKKDKVLVGFALETEGLYKNAVRKLKEKNLDFIVANRLTKRQDVFGDNKTSVLILDKHGNKEWLKGVTKDRVAERIIKKIEQFKKDPVLPLEMGCKTGSKFTS